MARERYALYMETGNSKELYTVLMALSTPSQNKVKNLGGKGGGDLDDEEDDDDEEEDAEEEEEGEEEGESEQEEEKIDGKVNALEKRLGGEAGVERTRGGAGSSDYGGANSRAPPADTVGRHGANEACDAPES